MLERCWHNKHRHHYFSFTKETQTRDTPVSDSPQEDWDAEPTFERQDISPLMTEFEPHEWNHWNEFLGSHRFFHVLEIARGSHSFGLYRSLRTVSTDLDVLKKRRIYGKILKKKVTVSHRQCTLYSAARDWAKLHEVPHLSVRSILEYDQHVDVIHMPSK